MAWLILLAAILLEIIGTSLMKLSNGFARPGPAALGALMWALSLTGLTIVLKTMQVSVAYAVWAGLGTAIVAVVGMVYFHEPVTFFKLVCLVMIVAGVVGLHLVQAHG